MENNISDKVINLWDMFWAVCLKWRLICLAAILAAILAGAWSYVRSARSISTQERPSQSVQMKQLSEEDQIAVEVYLDYMDSYNSQLLYNRESPLMQLDANGFYLSTLNYYVDNHFKVEYPIIAESNNVYAIVQAYQAALGDGEFKEKLQNELDTKDGKASSYIMEQVDCNNSYGARLNAGNTIGIMKVSIYGDTEETCRNLAAVVKATLNEKKEELVRQFGEHDMILTEETYNYVSDNELLAYQKTNIDRLYNYGRNLNDAKKLMSDEGQNFVEQLPAEELEHRGEDISDEATEVEAPSRKATVSKKRVLVGGVAGAFLVFAIVALGYLVNNSLLYEDDFEKLYGLKLFGRIEKQRKKKLFGFIDDFILKLRRTSIHHFREAEVVEMIYVGVKLAAEKRNINSVYVTGAGLAENHTPLLDEVIAKLKKDGIEVEMGKSILYYAGALEQSVKVGNVLLLEKAGQSLYQEIQREIEICSQQELNLLGAVVVE